MEAKANTYKDDLGRYRTVSLFWETCPVATREKYPPIWTLKEHDHLGYTSIRALYLKHRDPTEYKFAKAVLGSWDHWKKLCELGWFQKHLKEWRDELEVLLRSEGARLMMRHSEENVSAAKWIAQGDWKEQKAGRPKKEEVVRETKIQAKVTQQTQDEYDRIFGGDRKLDS